MVNDIQPPAEAGRNPALPDDIALRATISSLREDSGLNPTPVVLDELHEVLHHTLANVDGKAYRTMMGQIFAQRVSPAIDYTYDSDILKVG